MANTWTHRVVKRARGMQGQMFDFLPAATFADEASAREYAEAFAAEQADVGGVEITLRTRRGSCSTGRGAIIAVWRAGREVRLRFAPNHSSAPQASAPGLRAQSHRRAGL